jgi:hypothetical protein
MVRRAGSADLPLHGGRVPKWLGDRMTRLGAVITEAIVLEYGRDELLRRLAHPFWFRSFGAVMGMDWHSSGITSSVIGALKRGLTPLSGELGIHIRRGQLGEEPLKLLATQLPAQHHLSPIAHAMQREHMLGRINRYQLKLRHGRPPMLAFHDPTSGTRCRGAVHTNTSYGAWQRYGCRAFARHDGLPRLCRT